MAQPLVAGSENSVMGTRLGTKSRCLTRDQEACFSPEYVRGSVTEKVDVYAFGIVNILINEIYFNLFSLGHVADDYGSTSDRRSTRTRRTRSLRRARSP